MRAYRLSQPTGIDALARIDLPAPQPGPRQVLVKVMACSLNFRDLAIVLGTYRMPSRPNLVPLSDGAGEVVEVGPGVTRVKVGDRVAGNFFARWPGGEPPPDVQSTALGGATDGMLAEYVVLEEEGTVKIPAHLSLEEGATLPCAAVTVWHAMMEHAKLIAGQTVGNWRIDVNQNAGPGCFAVRSFVDPRGSTRQAMRRARSPDDVVMDDLEAVAG